MSIRQHKDFVRVWSGQAVSNIGDGVHRIAILWWARQATGSDLAVVAVALATVLPTIVVAPLAGWLVDRVDRRHLMMAADAVRVGTSGAIAGLAGAGLLHLWMVLVAAVVASAAGAAFGPAYMASITLLVPAEERAVANSMVGTNEAIAGIVGPALGGLLVGLWGTGSALWFDATTFLVSLLFVLASRVPMPPRATNEDDEPGAGRGMLAGLALLRDDRNVRDLTAVAVGLNTFAAPIPVLLVALAASTLSLGGTGYGLLEAAIPVGLVAGFAVAPRLITHRSVSVWALVLTGGGIALSGAAAIAVVAGAALVAAGVGIGIANTMLPTRFQQDVDPAVQGRVFALLGGLMQAGRPLGMLAAAPLVAAVGPRGGLAVCGVAMLLVTFVGRRGLLGAVPPGAPVPPADPTDPAEGRDMAPTGTR